MEERVDEVGALGEGNEFGWRDEATNRVVPAREDFKPCELSGAQLNERLEVRHDLVPAV